MPKTVLITGANRGIGLSFTQHYVKLGWRVIASARNVAAAAELQALAPWKIIALDTSNEQSILDAAKALDNVPVDLLINNAGVLSSNGLANTTKEDLMHQFEVNAVGPFLTTRAFLPNLRLAVKENGQAFVTQITSRMGSVDDNTSGGYYGYRASKTALNMISTSLSKDLAADKIGVLILHPGYVATAMTSNSGNITPDQSVENLTKIIDNAKLEDSGKFYHCEGYVLPW
ncbi:hypothetical protein PINS_up001248 [Pythium insidiosum]|nr:hypothetical protein PINS_up001248 [Pythium insidiosum]